MEKPDFAPFQRMLSLVAEQYGKVLSPELARFYFDGLAHLPMKTVRDGLARHVRNTDTGMFMPKLADVIRECDGLRQDGRPGPEEAWAMLPKSEDDSAAWTEEMREAWASAFPLIQIDDLVAARMTFLERYRELLRRAREGGVAVRWSMTLGHNRSGREAAVLEAVEKGRLLPEHAAGLLPYHRDSEAPERLGVLVAKTAKALSAPMTITERLAMIEAECASPLGFSARGVASWDRDKLIGWRGRETLTRFELAKLLEIDAQVFGYIHRMKNGPLSQNVVFDDKADTVTVYGVQLTGDLLRAWSEPTPEGQWFRITKIDGVLHVERKFERRLGTAETALMPPIRFTIFGEAASKANSRSLAIVGPPEKRRQIWIKSAKAREYESTSRLQVPARFRQMLEGPVRVTLRMFYASERPDLDESLVLDVLQARYTRTKGPLKRIGPGEYAETPGERKLVTKGVYANDRQVREKHVYHAVDKHNPRVEVEVEPMQPTLELPEPEKNVSRGTVSLPF